MRDRRAEQSFLHDSIKRQMAEQYDEYSSNFNPLDDASTPANMKHVGKSMFIINNREDSPDMPLRGAGPMEMASSLKDRIASCVEQAEKKPSMRRKLVESMLDLENQLNEIRAEEGFLAQMRAQQRVRESIQAAKEKEERDVEKLLERTAVLDSAVRAVGLQKLLQPSWNEDKNSYVIMSQLNERQKKKLTEMLKDR